MCGILFHSLDAETSPDVRFDLLAPRGPDESRTETLSLTGDGNEAFLGFHRLAIQNPTESGMQPFVSEGGRFHFLGNGEIYRLLPFAGEALGHVDPRPPRSDMDYLFDRLAYTIESGLDPQTAFRSVVGVFAVVLFDRATETLYWARDRLGVRPLFAHWWCKGNGLRHVTLASEAKAAGLSAEDVQQVPAGTWGCAHWVASRGWTSALQEPYWTLPPRIPELQQVRLTERLFSEAGREVWQLLRTAVQDRVACDRGIGVLLSGGLDSSIVTALLAELLGPENVLCFTLGVDGSSDVLAARQVTQELGIRRHLVFPVDDRHLYRSLPAVLAAIETCDVTTVRASAMQYELCRQIREWTRNTPEGREADVQVLFSGEGADELFGGYLYSHAAPSPAALDRDRRRLVLQLPYFDVLRTDRTTAAHGFEVRVPFLDHRLVEFVFSQVPADFFWPLFPLCRGAEKGLLRRAAQAHAALQLPASVVWRKKEAFSDSPSADREKPWFQKKFRDVSDEQFHYLRTLLASHVPYVRSPAEITDWLPVFGAEGRDPSARTLSLYSKVKY